MHTGTGAHQHLFKGSMALQRQKDTSLSTGPMERQRKTVMNSSNSISAVLCDMQLHCCQKSIKITSMSPRWWTSWHVSGVHFEAVLQALSHDKYARIKWNYILEGNNAILLHHQSVFLYTVSGKCQLKKKIPCDWPHLDNLPLLWTQLSHVFHSFTEDFALFREMLLFFSEVSTILLQHVWDVFLRFFSACFAKSEQMFYPMQLYLF